MTKEKHAVQIPTKTLETRAEYAALSLAPLATAEERDNKSHVVSRSSATLLSIPLATQRPRLLARRSASQVRFFSVFVSVPSLGLLGFLLACVFLLFYDRLVVED